MAVKKKSGRQSSKHPSASKRAPVSKRTASSQRTPPSKKVSATKSTKKSQRPRPGRTANVTAKTLDALIERLDIILPEVMMRIAAVEHLLVEKGYCSHEQLVGARQFIQEQEAT